LKRSGFRRFAPLANPAAGCRVWRHAAPFILTVPGNDAMSSSFDRLDPGRIGWISRIVSGGQTGADRAALDWAIANGVPHGGWCPKGRTAEDGPLDPRYCLTETEAEGYRQRTHANVRDSDGTLIVNLGVLDGGTFETWRYADKIGRPVLVAELDCGSPRGFNDSFFRWLEGGPVRTLNVAGPRESKRPGIYAATYDLLTQFWPIS
jgi:hypothetical protein